jgi:hypothetical protein
LEGLGEQEINIKMGGTEIICEVVKWIQLNKERAQWRGSCEYGNEPSGSIKDG